jgi:hypothetical protein
MSEPKRMPFGAHKGQLLSELDAGYLDWLDSIQLSPSLREAVNAEFDRRERLHDAHRAAALVTVEIVEAAEEIIRQGLRVLTRMRHPDAAGGSNAAMAAANNATTLLRALLRKAAE